MKLSTGLNQAINVRFTRFIVLCSKTSPLRKYLTGYLNYCLSLEVIVTRLLTHLFYWSHHNYVISPIMKRKIPLCFCFIMGKMRQFKNLPMMWFLNLKHVVKFKDELLIGAEAEWKTGALTQTGTEKCPSLYLSPSLGFGFSLCIS